LRSLRFWSVVLAKGHQELRINTGSNPMRARLTPLSGFSQSGIQNDQSDYDTLMLTEVQDDLSIPELGPICGQTDGQFDGQFDSLIEHERALDNTL
jgi:hypothetical protein